VEAGRGGLEEQWRQMRRGWYVGGEGFFGELRERLEKAVRGRRRESHSGAARRAHDEALFELGRLEQAVAWFDKALAAEPRLAKAWFSKGKALFQLGRTDEANICFEKAVEINPQCIGDWAAQVVDKAQKRQRKDGAC
jgi:tetratricopeptide (TPR) repeat protein